VSRQIIKQPDGKFSVYSSFVDAFILTDLTRTEVVEALAVEAANESRRNTKNILDIIEAGKAPYHQFTMTYEQANAKHLKQINFKPGND